MPRKVPSALEIFLNYDSFNDTSNYSPAPFTIGADRPDEDVVGRLHELAKPTIYAEESKTSPPCFKRIMTIT